MSLSCKCGEVKICFAVPKPVFTAECGCMDCVGKLNYLCDAPHPPALPAAAYCCSRLLQCGELERRHLALPAPAFAPSSDSASRLCSLVPTRLG